jgi:hypothetical protein
LFVGGARRAPPAHTKFAATLQRDGTAGTDSLAGPGSKAGDREGGQSAFICFVSPADVLSSRRERHVEKAEAFLEHEIKADRPPVRMATILTEPHFQAVACALIAFAVYLRTLAPTVMWYDMGEFATGAYVLGIGHNTGYPLFMLLGKLFTLLPVGDIAYRINLMSAFFGALTVLMVYLTVYGLTRARRAAFISALTIGFTSTLWSNATWAESYDLNAFLSILILYLVFAWMRSDREVTLRAAFLILGLGLGNHRLILVVVPAMLYLMWHQGRGREGAWASSRWLALVGFFLMGFAVNVYLPLRAAQHPALNWGDPSDLKRFLTMITTGYSRAFVNPFESGGHLSFWMALLILFPSYEFALVGLAVAAVGGILLSRSDRAIFVATVLVSGAAAALIAVYGIHNVFNYFQPIYLMLAIWLGAGAEGIIRLAGRGRGRLRVRLEWAAVALMLCIPVFLLVRGFPQLDRSQRREAADFAHYALSRFGSGADILADFWSWTPMEYVTVVEGQPGDVRTSSALSVPGLDQDALIDELAGQGRDVYLSVSSEGSPRLQVASHDLQLVAPYVIHSYPTITVPLPAFKDLLVPRGAIYRVIDHPPDLSVDEVPAADRRMADFGGVIQLRGFNIDHPVLARGEAFQATYYWSLSKQTSADYWADILFTDADGNVATQRGLPLWLHSHWLGGGAVPTSEWQPGTIMREIYDGLVPRLVAPGAYTVRAFIYTDPSRVQGLPVVDPAPGGGAILGVVQVR